MAEIIPRTRPTTIAKSKLALTSSTVASTRFLKTSKALPPGVVNGPSEIAGEDAFTELAVLNDKGPVKAVVCLQPRAVFQRHLGG